MADFRHGDRVRVLDESGASSGQTGTIRGAKAFTDQMTEIWMVHLDGADAPVPVPAKCLQKIDGSEVA